MLFFKRSFGPNIQLLAQKHVSDGYSGYVKKHRKVINIRDYINRYIFKPVDDPYLSISCSLHGYVIPMMDVDSEEDMAIAALWLKENDIEFNIIKSGHDSYWLFLDAVTKSNARAIKTVYATPGVDLDYNEFIRKSRIIAVRGFYRDPYYEPEIVSVGTDNTIVCSFCDKLIEHYQSNELKWLYRYRVFGEGDIDIADPKTGVVGKIALKDILNG
ncbi:MAG: hypothetical protein ACE1ZC_00305 [Nitrososphaerales archaeon]